MLSHSLHLVAQMEHLLMTENWKSPKWVYNLKTSICLPWQINYNMCCRNLNLATKTKYSWWKDQINQMKVHTI